MRPTVALNLGDDGRPKVHVEMQVRMPPELGGREVTVVVDLPVDHRIPGQGQGVDAMIDFCSQHTKAQLRKPHLGHAD